MNNTTSISRPFSHDGQGPKGHLGVGPHVFSLTLGAFLYLAQGSYRVERRADLVLQTIYAQTQGCGTLV